MQINVRTCFELKGKPLPLKHEYELGHLTNRNKQLLHVDSPVIFEGKGEMEAGLFVIEGEVRGEYTLACSRCLAELPQRFLFQLQERFQLRPGPSGEMDDEENDIHEVEGNSIDLLPFIEESLLLSIPFIPLCQSPEECQHHLPRKGKDWTVVTEEDQNNRVDPRLADLAKFFDQNKP